MNLCRTGWLVIWFAAVVNLEPPQRVRHDHQGRCTGFLGDFARMPDRNQSIGDGLQHASALLVSLESNPVFRGIVSPNQGRTGEILPAQTRNPPIAAPDLQGCEIQESAEDRLGANVGLCIIRRIML